MLNKKDKNAARQKRHERMRRNIVGTAERPRFNVYRSLSNIGTVRGNIRKKLALPGDADLRQYLQKKIKST